MSRAFPHHTRLDHPRTGQLGPDQDGSPRTARSTPPATPTGEQSSTPVADEPANAQVQQSDQDLRGMVEQPAKVMRIGTMIKQLLEEVRSAPLDEAGRTRLKEIHRKSITELEAALSPDLTAELDRLSLPFTQEDTPSEAELRIAQAQLVGWLEGLFHGLQTAIFAQQMASQAQLQTMRHELPPGTPEHADSGARGTGQYL